MTYDENRDEGEIRRRAAWLFGMLAVVAALLVVVMVFFLNGGANGSQHNAIPDPNYGNPTRSSQSPTHSGSSSSSATSHSTSKTSGAATSSTPVPKASCPSSSTCTVPGDIGGAVSAINSLRAQHGLSAVQASITDAADQCALTSGSDCPQSYVWVHVDDLSGKSVVAAVQGFNGTDNLLDADATKFAIGWAYDPSSESSSAAVIRVS